MNTKQLRQKILDLAIRGKLVPQDPNDEPASVLLERIKAEKEQLIKEGKIKRSKKSATTSDKPHYPDWDLPHGWECAFLGEILSVKSGSGIRVSDLGNDGEFPVYGGNGINAYYNQSNVEENTLIIGRVGYYCGSIHKTSRRAWVTDNALVVTPFINDSSFIQYLYYALIWLDLGQTSNSTAQPVVSGKGILPLAIPIPPKIEQEHIVNEIERLLNIVNLIENEQAELHSFVEDLKHIILTNAISGKLVPQDPTDEPAEELLRRINPSAVPADKSHYQHLPKGWCSCRLGDLIDFCSGLSYSKQDIMPNGLRIIRGGNIQNGEVLLLDDDVYISTSLRNESSEIKMGDIVMVASTGSALLIGKTGFANRDYSDTYIGAFLRIIRPLQKVVIPQFIHYILQSVQFKFHIRKEAKGSNINNIKKSSVVDYVISLPPINEQHRIIKAVENVNQRIDEIIREL